MSKVVDNFIIGKYSVLKIDEIPNKPYTKFKIGNNIFNPVPVYDAKNCIAIESNQKFLGKDIEFIVD